MGWDINGSVEITYNGIGWNRVINLFFLAREYDLFAKIFGVKGSGKEGAIAFNRGMPERPAAETLNEYLLESQRNKALAYPTWILASELSDYVHRLREKGWYDSHGSPIDWSWRYVLDTMMQFGKELQADRVRMVVWFGF